MGSQREDKMVKSSLVFHPLNWTFQLGGYINSDMFGEDKDIATSSRTLTINVITKKEEMDKTVCLTVYHCPPDFELNNWSIAKIPIVHKSSK